MNRRLQVLDAQRGLCALFVALMHARGLSHFSGFSFVQGSWLFVDFFFVLSGFVIALVYLDEIDGGQALVGFVIRRFGRLWPLHAFVLLLYVASETLKAVVSHRAGVPVHTPPFSGSTSAGTIGANLLLVHSLGFYPSSGWNAPSWSISVEFYTYLVFAALCVTARRWMVAAALILIGTSIGVLSLRGDDYLGTSLTLGIFRCWFGFFVGVLTLFIYRAVCDRGARLPAASVLEIVSLGLAIAIVIAGRDAGPVTLLAPFGFAAVVFFFAFEAGIVSRLLQRRAFTWLGDRSYAIYMIHSLVADTLVRVLLFAATVIPIHALTVTSGATDGKLTISFGDRFVTDLYVVLYIAAVLVCADLVHRAVERPGRTYFNRLAASYRARRAAAVPQEAN